MSAATGTVATGPVAPRRDRDDRGGGGFRGDRDGGGQRFGGGRREDSVRDEA